MFHIIIFHIILHKIITIKTIKFFQIMAKLYAGYENTNDDTAGY